MNAYIDYINEIENKNAQFVEKSLSSLKNIKTILTKYSQELNNFYGLKNQIIYFLQNKEIIELHKILNLHIDKLIGLNERHHKLSLLSNIVTEDNRNQFICFFKDCSEIMKFEEILYYTKKCSHLIEMIEHSSISIDFNDYIEEQEGIINSNRETGDKIAYIIGVIFLVAILIGFLSLIF